MCKYFVLSKEKEQFQTEMLSEAKVLCSKGCHNETLPRLRTCLPPSVLLIPKAKFMGKCINL